MRNVTKEFYIRSTKPPILSNLIRPVGPGLVFLPEAFSTEPLSACHPTFLRSV
jgi:hypothetical protein